MHSKPLITLLVAAVCWSQQPAAQQQLKINVIQGEGATNNTSRMIASQPAVEVVDENGKPVENAEVTFETPRSGPTVMFFGEMRRNTVTTDSKGLARPSMLTPNDQNGKFQIKIQAKAGNRFAETAVNQTNSPGPGWNGGSTVKKNNLTKILLVGAAVAIVGGVVAAKTGGSSTTEAAAAKKPVSIGVGPITVGGPR